MDAEDYRHDLMDSRVNLELWVFFINLLWNTPTFN